MMKKYFLNLLIISLLFLCMACPYQSNVPLSEKGMVIDDYFLGKWTNKNQINKDFFAILQHNDHQYKIEENVYSEADKSFSQKTYLASISDIDGQLYFNVKPSETEELYLIYRLKKGTDQITLSPLTENIKESFKSVADFQNFVRKHKDLSFFYGKDQVFKRLKD